VSPFSGEAIISPTDKNDVNDARKLLRVKRHHFSMLNVDLHTIIIFLIHKMWIAQMGANVSWANIKRLSSVLFPPTSQILADLLMGGYLVSNKS
jgi:hypothetical protein